MERVCRFRVGVVEKTGSVFGFVGHYHDIDGLSEHTAGSL